MPMPPSAPCPSASEPRAFPCRPPLGRWTPGLLLALALGGCGSPELASRASNAIVAEPLPEESLSLDQPESSAALLAPAELNVHGLNLDEQGQALRGYDAVTYFTENTARPGSPDVSLQWDGATWLFSNAENRDRFAQQPERYAPANGGYCTFGIVLGQKFDGDPQVWSIEGDRLYLFLNREIQAKFHQDKQENLTKVAQNWPAIRNLSPEALE